MVIYHGVESVQNHLKQIQDEREKHTPPIGDFVFGDLLLNFFFLISKGKLLGIDIWGH